MDYRQVLCKGKRWPDNMILCNGINMEWIVDVLTSSLICLCDSELDGIVQKSDAVSILDVATISAWDIKSSSVEGRYGQQCALVQCSCAEAWQGECIPVGKVVFLLRDTKPKVVSLLSTLLLIALFEWTNLLAQIFYNIIEIAVKVTSKYRWAREDCTPS